MKIAVIGAAISGNLVARLLAGEHEVWLFEAEDYVGGHTNTVSFDAWGRSWHVDTGFMVFNDRTYPDFVRLLQLLGLAAQDSDMSFSVSCARTGLEYQGSSLNGLFAQRQNLVRPSFYGMLRDILQFNRQAPTLLNADAESLTLGEYLARSRCGPEFVDRYLIPMTAAIWSARPRAVQDFPAHFLIGFFCNHGLLQVWDRPQWKTNRLRVSDLPLPPLRKRGEDAIELAASFLDYFRRQVGCGPRRPSTAALAAIRQHPWAGNIREWKNAVERTVVLGPWEEVSPQDLGLATVGRGSAPCPEMISLREAERRHIEYVLGRVAGNKAEACRVLGMGRGTLYNKIQEYGITDAT